ncbi:hypothetical protein [Gynuella sunshinyii]|uniref:Sulfite reductase, alpha subunit (Flavoprotein) n=1 Tax=Gynuella sunshinyii YC6258 TaxID=1445510 RepID=A0A0C5VEI0_9GAMM|nr:hypothetical protein [Gynuella sunshinyii]AJQ92616.1 sulfite reductase, alpha subunit (flavoprotein) [Gynuella sunshinyii YC6258]
MQQQYPEVEQIHRRASGAIIVDCLYQNDLHTYLADQRLTNLSTAFSRLEPSHYVQDKLMADCQRLQSLVQKGAQILVRGGK